MIPRFLIGLLVLIPTNSLVSALKIASALNVIEYTPEVVAIKDYYKGDTASITNGGVANIVSDISIDLATNAETQALRQFASHKNLRIIATVCEVAYRIVANSKSIKTLQDLKGKRIGSIPGTSAGYFVQKLLATVGLKTSDYTLVSGNVCLSAPCGSGTFPAMLKQGTIDAVGLWEPTVQLAADALGSNVVFFQNKTVYREVFNLHSTSDKLNNPTTRKNIVAFLKALLLALKDFQDTPDKVYARVASTMNMNATLVKAVWPVHSWPGVLPPDLLDVLVAEDQYVAGQDRRSAMSRDSLSTLIDSSVLADAMKA